MIKFQSFTGIELDLTRYGVSLNEENNMFVDSLIKSYSYPFSLFLTNELSTALGFIGLNDVDFKKATIKGYLIIDNDYFAASLKIKSTKGKELEATLYYGEEELDVYSTPLQNLPWPLNIVTATQEIADKHFTAGWPDVTHNFPKVFWPAIQEKSDYGDFLYFANNYDGIDFVQNETTGTAPDLVYSNKNVLLPCPYLLEMVAFGYQVAGRKPRGNFFSDERFKKLLYIPKNFLEKFKGDSYTAWQFSTPDRTYTNEGLTFGVYERLFNPSELGTYELDFNLEIPPALVDYFNFRVYQKDAITEVETNIYTATSRNNRVSINDKLSMNITQSQDLDPIWIEVIIPYTTTPINNTNSFEFSYKQGRLNDLESSYTLADFMPDMTFGKFVTAIKNWFNLDIVVDEETVTINFIEEKLRNLTAIDHSQYEEPEPFKEPNTDRVFKLIYKDKSQVLVDKTGLIYSDVDRQKEDIITINIDVQMAVVEQNYNVVTAVKPDNDGLSFAIFDSPISGSNNAIDKYSGFTGKVDNVYELFWKNWLQGRTNNQTIKETFQIHAQEQLNVNTIIHKYNKLLLPKSIRKRRTLDQYWEIEMESETI